jgi:hypothetical protein
MYLQYTKIGYMMNNKMARSKSTAPYQLNGRDIGKKTPTIS